MLKVIEKNSSALNYVGDELINDKEFLSKIKHIDSDIISNDMILEFTNVVEWEILDKNYRLN